MDVSNIARLATAMSNSAAGQAVGIAVLKKAMDLQAQSAAELLQALPQAGGNPPHLGQNVDVRA